MEGTAAEFISYIASERALSANTQAAYQNDLEQFFQFCQKSKIELSSVSLRDLRRFLAWLRKAGNSERSLARKTSTLKQFFQFLLRESTVTNDPTELLTVRVKSKNLPKILTEGEMLRLIQAASGTNEQETRDRAMLELWYATGARVSEIAGLKIRQIDWGDGVIRIRGKGGHERLIPLSHDAREWCERYRDVRLEWLRRTELKDPDSFFLSLRGKAFTRQGIWKLLQKYVKRAGITRRVWPHMIRHSFATHILEGGADLRVVQELLGHRSISTTEIYTHLDIENLKVMQVKFHPRR